MPEVCGAIVRAFLYARVSTGEQHEGMQLREMQEFAKRRGWDTEIFPDVGQSGAKERRPELDRMMALVRKRKCDVVLVYRFDRFARSLRQLVNALEEFKALGVQFVSVHENIDTTLPHGELMFHLFAAIAQFERALIRERVKSGVEHARAKGVRLGRPRRIANNAKILSQRRGGMRWGAIARKHEVSISTAKRLAHIAIENEKIAQKSIEKQSKNAIDSKNGTGPKKNR